MEKCAYIIDSYSQGSYHEVINQGYLMMISELYEKVTYVAERSSCINIKNLLNSCGFDYSNVTFVEKDFHYNRYRWAGLDYFLHLIDVSLNNYKLYKQTPPGCDVFYNNNLHFATTLISIFAKSNKNKIIDMCHSELESIDPNFGGTRVNKLMGAYYRYLFKYTKIDKKFRFIVLSSAMAEYFKTLISTANNERIGWIDHCYIRPDNKTTSYGKVLFDGIKIGIPGLISPTRGLPELKQVLAGLNNEAIKLYSISAITEHISNPHFCELNTTGKLLPFTQYNYYINQMDCLALFYTPGSYKLTASGAVLEAIWNEKPIIAFENEFFKYLFSKFGELGILCADVNSLKNKLIILAPEDISKYKSNLLTAKKLLMPSNVKQQLKKEIEYVSV